MFLSKYKKFTQDGSGPGLRIDLSRNFRSRAEVLDGTNYLFKQVMGEKVGEIAYDIDAELKLGAQYPPSSEMNAELLLISKGPGITDEAEEGQFDAEELETVQLEARLMASKIRELVHSRFQVYDRKLNGTRNITYKDIVILLRSMPWAPQILEEFKQQGIPVYASLSNGYFEATEVAIMMSLLKVIDNPYQDIPLASVLRSPVIGLSSNELATIKLYGNKGAFYDAVKGFLAEAGREHQGLFAKISGFYSSLQGWRDLARKGSVSDLIWQLYRDTKFFDYVGGMPGGKQRQANLRAFYDRSRQYESTSFRGLFRFLRFIERMQERGDDLGAARALGEQEDVVRIMTTHSSKGLEFPVVFAAGLARQFNMMDLNKKHLLDKELGFGTKYIHPKYRISYPTLPLTAIKKKMKVELLSEELRVLYVALTRAKEKLFLIGTMKDAEKSIGSWTQMLEHKDWLIPDHERLAAKSYLDWIGPAIIRHRDARVLSQSEMTSAIADDPSKWSVSIVEESDLVQEEFSFDDIQSDRKEALENGEPVPLETKWAGEVEERLTWKYSFQDAAVHRAKQSVSEIKRQQEYHDEYSDTSILNRKRNFLYDRPTFMQEKKLTAAEQGTALHAFMQHVPLKKGMDQSFLRNYAAELVSKEILTSDQYDALQFEHIVSFFSSEIGLRLLMADHVSREVPFNLALPAEEVYKEHQTPLDNESVLVQGIIDCLFEDSNGLVLLDFKTDAIQGRFQGGFEGAKEILKDRYEVQVNLYALAVEKILKRPVASKYLYFLDGGYLLEIKK